MSLVYIWDSADLYIDRALWLVPQYKSSAAMLQIAKVLRALRTSLHDLAAYYSGIREFLITIQDHLFSRRAPTMLIHSIPCQPGSLPTDSMPQYHYAGQHYAG